MGALQTFEVQQVVQHSKSIEYFHDHVRIENMFFDGVIQPLGRLSSDLSRPGMGLEFKKVDAKRYAA